METLLQGNARQLAQISITHSLKIIPTCVSGIARLSPTSMPTEAPTFAWMNAAKNFSMPSMLQTTQTEWQSAPRFAQKDSSWTTRPRNANRSVMMDTLNRLPDFAFKDAMEILKPLLTLLMQFVCLSARCLNWGTICMLITLLTCVWLMIPAQELKTFTLTRSVGTAWLSVLKDYMLKTILSLAHPHAQTVMRTT